VEQFAAARRNRGTERTLTRTGRSGTSRAKRANARTRRVPSGTCPQRVSALKNQGVRFFWGRLRTITGGIRSFPFRRFSRTERVGASQVLRLAGRSSTSFSKSPFGRICPPRLGKRISTIFPAVVLPVALKSAKAGLSGNPINTWTALSANTRAATAPSLAGPPNTDVATRRANVAPRVQTLLDVCAFPLA